MAVPEPLTLRLFVAGDSPESAIAIANLQALFPQKDRALDGQGPVIEIVDVQREPARAARDRILVTPTLLKLSPAPPCRILGNLRNTVGLMSLLGISGPDPA